MKTAHLIADELFEQAMSEIQAGKIFIAYNSSQYLLNKGDMEFFSNAPEANEYAFNNSSDRDQFTTLKAESVMDIYDHFEIIQALIEHPTILSHLKNTTMEENNYEYLAKQLKWAGLGETLNDELRKRLQDGKPEFSISHDSAYGKDAAVTTLNFKKSTEKEMYFFNSYSMKLNIFGQEHAVEQKFYINNKQDNITLKEAYNLLSGRAVEKEITPKEGEKYQAWLQLDFKETDTNGQYKMKQFHPNYGFDLEKVLNKHPLRELETPEGKKQLMESLQRGNRQMVTLEAEGKDIKLFVEAAPQYKSLNYYDSNVKRMQSQELTSGTKESNGTVQKQENKKENVKQAGGADDDVDGPNKKRARRQSV